MNESCDICQSWCHADMPQLLCDNHNDLAMLIEKRESAREERETFYLTRFAVIENQTMEMQKLNAVYVSNQQAILKRLDEIDKQLSFIKSMRLLGNLTGWGVAVFAGLVGIWSSLKK